MMDGVSIKIDIPTSQYGTLEWNHKLYNVHVGHADTWSLPEYPEIVVFTIKFLGQDARYCGEDMGQSTEDLLEELQALIRKLEATNQTTERSRNLSLTITRLEDAEDKLIRHVQDLN